MIKQLLFTTILILSHCSLHAQKKSELISQNQELKFQLDSIRSIISTAKRNEKIGQSKVEEYKKQVTELQEANATLLKNLNNFAALSNQNSDNINKTLATLERKEAQLKDITDAVARNDSTAVVLLSKTKRSIGETAKVNVTDGIVIISEKLDFFFENGLGTEINEASKSWIQTVSKIVKEQPNHTIRVVGLSSTGEFDTALKQATVIASILLKEHQLTANKLSVSAEDGGFKEAIHLEIIPDYKAFYETSKASVKN